MLARSIKSVSRVGTQVGSQVSFRAGSIFARTKVTLPELSYDFGALEPFISGQINELHYTKHHQTYVNNYNNAIEEFDSAIKDGDTKKQLNLLPVINFNGGGFQNHNLWWEGLAPQKEGGGAPPAENSALALAIAAQYGGLDNLINITNTRLAGIQGSGWAWIVRNKETDALDIITTANQDTVPSKYVPVVGIDAWEHAYYLQYQNVKVDYFKNIWNVINWQVAARRFDS